MTGTSFINRSQTEVFGEAFGITFIEDCFKVGNWDLVKSFCLYQGCRYSHHLSVTEGRFLGRSGEGGKLVLGLLWPLFGGLNHLPGVSGHRRSSDDSGMLPVSPALLEGIPHVECERLQRLLAVPPLHPT